MASQRQRFGLIINSHARQAPRYLERNQFWKGAIPDTNVLVTSCIADLEAAVAILREREVDVIASLGGDGTLHHLVNAMDTTRCSATILPLAGGTINGIARAFGFSGRSDQVFLRTLIADAMPARQQHMLRLEGAITRIGFTMAAGLGFAAARSYAVLPRRGTAAVIRSVVMAATGRLTHSGVEIALGSTEREYFDLVAAGTITEPFLWFRPFGRQPIGSAELGFTALKVPRSGLLLGCWPMLRGDSKNPGVQYFRAPQTQIDRCDGIVFDGELYEFDKTSSLILKIGPKINIMDAHALGRF